MYKSFFGFRERPFQLVPNPDFLFLSEGHEEALAHLMYAVSQGDGFVEITGEVGTGKTTLCRTFLENLDEDTEAAYIFNPRMNSVELLKAINDEFGIDSSDDNTKDLIDTLNFFLMRKKSQGKNIILLIDEAQNLSTEVLEQLRLLSNLETTTTKLLQIILVGQPELSEKLDSYELRQLGQRITLSCHLSPMTQREMRDYIEHRIGVVSAKPSIRFTGAAYNEIFRFSGGIPRLVNIACERSILTAFGLNKKKITGRIAGSAVREVASRGDMKRYHWEDSKKGLFALAMLCLTFVLVIFYFPRDFRLDWIFEKIDGKETVAANLPILEKPKKPEKVLKEDEEIKTVKKSIVLSKKEKEEAPKNELKNEIPEVAVAEVSKPAVPAEEAEKTEPRESPEKAGFPTDSGSVKTEPPANADPGKTEPHANAGPGKTEPPADAGPGKTEPHAKPAEKSAKSPARRTYELTEYMRNMNFGKSADGAIQTIRALWNVEKETTAAFEEAESAGAFFKQAGGEVGFSVLRVEENLGLLKKINLPAILEIHSPENTSPGYLTLVRIEDGMVYFKNEKSEMAGISSSDLKFYWLGVAYIPWINYYACEGTIPRESTDDSVSALKKLLADAGFDEMDARSTVYDERTKKIIENIQRKHGFKVDGIVGPLTKIALYNELDSLGIPHILSF